MDDILTLTYATERDVDLLVIEELRCSASFVRWLADIVAKRVERPIDYIGSDVAHSMRRIHNSREIDITLRLEQSGVAPIVLLIENKLDTSEQVMQAESYAEEAQMLVKSGRALFATTVLICPSDYKTKAISFAQKFQVIVTYEEIAEFLSNRGRYETGELASRLIYRQGLLHQAIQKSRRGYQPVPFAVIEQFNAKYVDICRQICPSLKPGPSMLKEGRPGESKTMIFAPATLPSWQFLPQMRIVHQLREGNANVCFYTWGNRFSTLAGQMGQDLAGTPFRIVPTVNKRPGGNSGLMVVADTPSIDNERGFDAQRDDIVSGMKAVDTLRNWIFTHKDVIEGWARLFQQ